MENLTKLMKDNGCSDEFIEIIYKYQAKENVNLSELERFINELETYKADEAIPPFEQDVLDQAKEKYMFYISTSNSMLPNDDSTEMAIRRSEINYNGDVFDTMGFAMYTDDGRRY